MPQVRLFSSLFLSIAVVGFAGWACSSSSSSPGPGTNGSAPRPVGAPCVPSDEQDQTFSGFQTTEVVVDSASASCASHTCIADHFQGRATCPYGQSETDLTTEPADSPHRCRMQTSTGTVPVTAVVASQLVARRAADVVTCSCRCAGPDPSGSYCTCPAGTECAPLVQDFGFDGGMPLPGSYCIKTGTQYQPGGSTLTCSASSTDLATDCGNGRANP